MSITGKSYEKMTLKQKVWFLENENEDLRLGGPRINKRFELAKAAMQGLLSGDSNGSFLERDMDTHWAKCAVATADALIAELEKAPP